MREGLDDGAEHAAHRAANVTPNHDADTVPSSFNQAVDYRRIASIFNRMVEHDDGRLDLVFRALSDQTRRAMLARLADQFFSNQCGYTNHNKFGTAKRRGK